MSDRDELIGTLAPIFSPIETLLTKLDGLAPLCEGRRLFRPMAPDEILGVR